MQKRTPYISASVIILSILFIIGSCTKLDTTTIGGDLIPAIDNVNTFADTLDIQTTQGVFDQDSTKLGLSENYVIGHIQDDHHDSAGISATDASLYLQMRPSFYPFYIGGQPKDTIIKADSVVLCLSYKGFWGDSTQPIHLQVFEIGDQSTRIPNFWDSVYRYNTIREDNAPTKGQSLSVSKAIDIRSLGNYTKVGIHDSVNYQIRIKLNDAFRDRLFSRDSLTNSFNNAFHSDSLFRLFNNGFAIEASSSDNALVYTDLFNDGKTRLELHYSKRSRTDNDTGYAATIDTVYSNFYFNSGYTGGSVRKSAVANKIIRNPRALPSGVQELYLQTTPGTFANLRIPQLEDTSSKFYKDTLMNSVINRAEIEIQQIPDPNYDNVFNAPNYMYLDLVDSVANKWKPIYYDLNPSSSYDPDFKTGGIPYFPSYGAVDFTYFGGYIRKRVDIAGTQSYYNINITRYVQKLITQPGKNYELRLFPAHSFSYPQYGSVLIPYPNTIAYGSVKVGGGNNPNAKYRMRMRIIYTKIK